ncbi:MAG: HIT family protein [Chloroflexi bacterium]|nr:MAG: HIT family protein [Chloroflexota bacterium]TME92328.1 MAG: HIT family protein [Chloroflexota bacterium]
MPSIFSRIIAGELPARFVWKDDRCVAFLSNRPLRPGHTLVVPRLEVDHWLDADPELLGSLSLTAQVIGKAQMAAFDAARIGVLIAGLEVPHLHIHVVPIRGLHDLDFGNQDPNPDEGMMDRAAQAIRDQLREQGHEPPSD